MSKQTEINYGLEAIRAILQMLKPEKRWIISYAKITSENITNFSDWNIQYHGIRTGDEYFFIWEDSPERPLLYVVNVSAESTLYSLANLMKLLADKF